MSKFTTAKAKVREINLKGLQSCLQKKGRPADLSYFGLPAGGLEDVWAWSEHLGSVDAVERGARGREWRWQHGLAVNAILWGVPNFRLLRGDIDDVILDGRDAVRQPVKWPYDVVNLDYSGGIMYKKPDERPRRVEAIKKVIGCQGECGHPFFLCITVNDRHHDLGEITETLQDIARDSEPSGPDLAEQLASVVSAEDQRMAVFVYLAYVVLNAGRWCFGVRPLRPILYEGNKGYRMLNASFCLSARGKRSSPAPLCTSYRELMALSPVSLGAT